MDNKDIKNNNLDLMDSIDLEIDNIKAIANLLVDSAIYNQNEDLEIIASLINQKVINIRDLANKLYKNGGVSGD